MNKGAKKIQMTQKRERTAIHQRRQARGIAGIFKANSLMN
jgi:hypothetical protein